MKNIVLLLAVVLVLAVSAVQAGEWQRADSGLNEINFNCITVHPKIAGLLFAGTGASLYRSSDNGKQWKAVLNPKRQVNSIMVDEEKGLIYAGTSAGLYESVDDGLTWKQIFKGRDKRKNILCLAKSKSGIFLGTEAGLLSSQDNRGWSIVDSGLPNHKVLSIAVNASVMYVVTEQGVFSSRDSGLTFNKVFINKRIVDDSSDDSEETGDEEEEITPRIRHVALDEHRQELVYLATENSVTMSQDSGKSWQALTSIGFLNKNINFILIVGEQVYAAAEKGVYVYNNEKGMWQDPDKGITFGNVRYLAYDKFSRMLWAAGNDGVFSIALEPRENTYIDTRDYSAEPSIKEVQELAIEYAEVEPEKIIQWRKQARLKAILPELTFGFDRSKSDTYEIYTSSTTNYSIAGPTDRTSGWDVSLSWDLGDLIWNDDQTNIDVRSRLMVELRNDILDEVNRAYFERRRLQMELASGEFRETRKMLEKELRIEELTATLDGFTGGRFSQAATAQRR